MSIGIFVTVPGRTVYVNCESFSSSLYKLLQWVDIVAILIVLVRDNLET